LCSPSSAGLLVAGLWTAFLSGVHVDREDVEPFIGVTAVLGIIFGIPAAFVFTATWEKYRRVSHSVLTHDQDAFMADRDERMPIMIHCFLMFVAMCLIAMFAVLPYSSTAWGALVLFCVSSCLVIYFVVTVELEDSTKSVWLTNRVPPGWMVQDVDRYFHTRKHGR